MDLIERYVFAVIRHLPPKQRADTEKKLRSLIEDRLQQRTAGNPPQPEDVEAVLLELGDPKKRSDDYRGSPRYLISPAFFDTYWLSLRIALLAVGFSVLLAMVVKLAVNPPDQIWQAFSEIMSGLYNGLLATFAVVTLIFGLIEHFNPQAEEQLQALKGKWQPGLLPKIPVRSLRINRADPIASIVFTLIFLCIINVDYHVIGMYIHEKSNWQVIPLFSDYFGIFLPWLNLSMILSIVIESIKLVFGRWTIPLVAGSIAQKALGLIISLRMFASARIFNAGFFDEMINIFQKDGTLVSIDLAARVCRVLTILIILGFAVDVLTTGWKAIRICMDRQG